jgi:hypothetical protein
MKKPYKSVLTVLREFIVGDPLVRHYGHVERAIKRKAERVADAEFARTMAHFYTERVLNIDHNVDWWGFADAKQKQHDYQRDTLLYDKRVDEASQQAEARMKQYQRVAGLKPVLTEEPKPCASSRSLQNSTRSSVP